MNASDKNDVLNDSQIAIVGMSGRFPGAENIGTYWDTLKNGVESISFFSDAELEEAGVPSGLLKNPNYVKAGAMLENVEMFDASFFGFSPKEAEMMDPQPRIFLECAWEALEIAGYDPDAYAGTIGCFAGEGMNMYMLNSLYPRIDPMESAAFFQATINNDKDALTTLTAYKLNLTGPSVTVQTACSTSLVAVHLACQSLLNGECDLALAGGVSISIPQTTGYLYHDGMILSPDGHCRVFDADAKGMVSGSGAGVVVLKRLDEAVAQGDCISAVIKGSAVNNDGALKVDYTAPSVDGQAEVVAEAQAVSGVAPDSIGYIEAHGTGTALGDPIEIAALTKAFRRGTDKKGFCAIGSVKTNIGHLDTAAGVAGLIKTVMALEHGLIPASLHFKTPNPEIDFDNSPFFVNTRLSEWKTKGTTPRRAGVSSFGIGGTNAHLIVEQAPPRTPADTSSRAAQVMVLSAGTKTALEKMTANLADHLKKKPGDDFADIAFTLGCGRKAFEHRRFVIAKESESAATAFSGPDAGQVFTGCAESRHRPVAFMFSGQGAQHVNMGLETYRSEPEFRRQVDLCCGIIAPMLELDLRDVLYPREGEMENAKRKLAQTAMAQPALFILEYALARLWMSWGVRPETMLGHSIGEYTAATLSGVFSLEDGLSLVAARAQLMQQQPGGTMMAVGLAEEQLMPLLDRNLFLSAVNGPSLCVVSGETDAMAGLRTRLEKRGTPCKYIHTSHAFHSGMMAPVLEPFAEQVGRLCLNPPQIPFISNLTGTWITSREATDPQYWVRHLRHTVQFYTGLKRLLDDPEQILLEVGPGTTLHALAMNLPEDKTGRVVLHSLPHPLDARPDTTVLLTTLGNLWLAGAPVDWHGFYAHEKRRVPLPTYPFERRRYWVAPVKRDEDVKAKGAGKITDIHQWFYTPSWQRSVPPLVRNEPDHRRRCLIFGDTAGMGAELATFLVREGRDVVVVEKGPAFTRRGSGTYTIDPAGRGQYEALFDDLRRRGRMPETVVHMWSVTPEDREDSKLLPGSQASGFFSLLFLSRALGKQYDVKKFDLRVVSNNLQDVSGEEILHPEKSTLLGPVRVIGQEYPDITCQSIDIDVSGPEDQGWPLMRKLLLSELAGPSVDPVIALRGRYRWVQIFTRVQVPAGEKIHPGIRNNGVYLITGGLGGIGMVFAEHLARVAGAGLILTGRTQLPGRREWTQWLEDHDGDNSVSLKIRKLMMLEELGARVAAFSADAADPGQMQAAVDFANKRFGKIHGVIHAAGITDGASFCTIEDARADDCTRQFRPKVDGTMVLEQVLAGQNLDFCLLMSSLSSVLGGLQYASYAAANAFLDAFACRHNRKNPVPWISVGWDGWRLDAQDGPINGNTSAGAAIDDLTITAQEGVAALHAILSLSSDTNQVVVSTSDLQARIDRWVRHIPGDPSDKFTKQDSAQRHERPELSTPYVRPGTEVEQKIARIWEIQLGIKRIGIHDNFFELGGHSLLSTQVVSRLRRAFKVDINIRDMFDAPTVDGLARRIGRLTSGTRRPRPKHEGVREEIVL